jgi:hypothetical protein
VRFWHVFSQGVNHSSARVALGSDRLVQPPNSHLTHRNPHRAKTRQEIAKWMEEELKKLGEAIYWSAQKFNI